MKWAATILPLTLLLSFYLMSEKGEHGFVQETVLENGDSPKDDSMEQLGRERDQASQEAERQRQLAKDANSDHSCSVGDCPDNENRSIDSDGRRSWRMIVPSL